MARTHMFTPEQVAEAILRSAGIISHAAQALGVSHATIRNYIKANPICKEAVKEARDTLVDLAESRLVQAINQGQIAAIIFTLKTLGRERGYVERHEVNAAPADLPAEAKADLATMTDEDRATLRAMVERLSGRRDE